MKRAVSCILVVSLLCLQGCGGGMGLRLEQMSPAALKEGLGTVGIVVVREPGKKKPHDGAPTPATGVFTGFGKGASLGFNSVGGSAWFQGWESSGDSSSAGVAYLYAGILALTGSAALGGGIYGTFASLFKSVPRKNVKPAKAAIERALDELDPVRMLKAEFQKLARSREDLKIIVLDPEDVKWRRSGGLEGVDSLITVRVRHAGLTGRTGLNPDLWIFLSLGCEVRTQILPFGVYARTVGYDNKKRPRKFIDWGAEDAESLRSELEGAYPFLAESVIKAVLDPQGVLVPVPAPTGA